MSCGTSSPRCKRRSVRKPRTPRRCTRTTPSSHPDGRRGRGEVARVEGARRRHRPQVEAHMFARERLLLPPRRGGRLRLRSHGPRARVRRRLPRARVVDMDGMSEMCSISGRSFDRILEEGAEGMTGVAGGAAAYGVGDPTGERGWVRPMLRGGYGASSRREMYETLWGGGGARAHPTRTSPSRERCVCVVRIYRRCEIIRRRYRRSRSCFRRSYPEERGPRPRRRRSPRA